MKLPDNVTLPIIAGGLCLIAVSFLLMKSNEGAEPQAPRLSLPVADYVASSAFPHVEDWMYQGWTPAPPPAAQVETAADDPASTKADTDESVEEASESAIIVRVRVPRVGIDAPVEPKSVDSAGVMQDPEGPLSVAWYDFSARPGTVGNIVMAGHVDYHNYGPAVFWNLRDLKQGDQVEVMLSDGETFLYQVESLNSYSASDAPVEEIVGPTPFESLTLITCGGSFDSSRREYNDRLVVRAVRVTTTATTEAAASN